MRADDMATTLNVPGTYPTISAAVTAAASGDTILVAAGYAGNEAVGVTVDNLIFSAPSDVLGIVLTAGTGVQQITLDGTSPIRIIGNTADNTFQGNAGANDISGGGGNDTMSGGDGNDTLTGGNGNDLLSGGAGDDTLVGGGATAGGTNRLDGGDGHDTASYASTTGRVTAWLGGPPDTGPIIDPYASVDGVLVDLLYSIENLTGGPADDILQGNSGDNVLIGGAGTDYLYGYGGNDTFIGGAAGSGGPNLLDGSGFSSGYATASYVGTTGAVYADLGTQKGYVDGVLVDQMRSIFNLIGGSGSNTLVGEANNNRLEGGAGTDFLYGGGGADTLIGGAGTDYLYGQTGNNFFIGGAAGSAGANQLWGGTGSDTASYAGTTGAVYADLGALAGYVDGVLVDQMSDIENLIGGSGSNTLVGNYRVNRLEGGAGTDFLYGGDGGDTLIGGAGTDYLYGEAGNDGFAGGAAGSAGANQLWGGTGNDTAYYGGAGAVHADLGTQTGYVDGVLVDEMNSIENLTGGSNADTLVGNSGANRLEGSLGGDALWGKGGADVFVYSYYQESNLVTGYDTIADFASGTSKLDLSFFHTNAAHVLIQSDAQSTSLYVERTPGILNASTDLAISLVGANAIAVGDILF
jgi:Ca2+-binding RTX toxin-like protein